MNKICTYVGTTISTIILLFTTVHAQNNPPVQVVFDAATTYHQPIIIDINQVLNDPDGDKMYLDTNYIIGTVILSDTTFEYTPDLTFCGIVSLFFRVCDTSLVFNTSICDTFELIIDDECSWLPLSLVGMHPNDTVCNGETVSYTPTILGGSGAYRIELVSYNPDDSIGIDIWGYTSGTVTYNNYDPHHIYLKVFDQYSGDSLIDIPYTTTYIKPGFDGVLDTDSTYVNRIGFAQTGQGPGHWNHTMVWKDSSGNVLQINTLSEQSTEGEKINALTLSVSYQGYYTLDITNHETGCIFSATSYYAGLNHPFNRDDISPLLIGLEAGGATTMIRTYTGHIYENENDLNYGQITFTNIVTPPTKGAITYVNGEMYYTPSNQCGLDTFFAIGCDSSDFLPYTTCDTIMVIMSIDCFLNIQPFAVQNVSCNGGADGAAGVTVQGATMDPTYITYLWSTGATTPSISGLAAGTYIVTVTYQNAFSDVDLIVITQPFATLQPTVQAQNTCGASCNGSAVTTMFGGTAPYTYLWNNGSTAANLTNLCMGTYIGTIVDAMGCTISPVFTILQDTAPITISLVTTDIDCNNTTGSITATGNNGVPPYTYTWDNIINSQSVYQTTAGTHYVEVRDATGCVSSAMGTILNNTGLSAAVVDSILPTCVGATNGWAQIAPAGGVAPYTYLWVGNASTTNTATGLSAGINTVTISDNAGCSFVYHFSLSAQTVLSVSNTTVHANCAPNAPGQITVQVNNGIAPISYAWNTGATGATMQGPAGVYQLTVTDANGCSSVNSVSVYNHSLFASVYTQPENCGLSNGSANVIAYAGNLPYTYQWNNNTALNNDTLYNVPMGMHTIKVTDAVGCYRTAQVEVLADCYAVLQGNIFSDENGDCMKQVSEVQPVIQSTITAVGAGNTYYGTVYLNGSYVIVVRDTGNYNVSLSNLSECFVVCSTQAVNVPSLSNTYGVNPIGYHASSFNHDFKVAVSGWGFTPGFDAYYYLYVSKINNPNSISPTAVLYYNPNMVFVSATDGGVNNSAAHTVTWSNINSAIGTTSLQARFNTPISLVVGNQIISTAAVLPDDSDCNATNNAVTVTHIVTGSYDPNMKVADPATEILETDSVLHYTIHFQNTGNDTTHFIVLKDTLSQLVDPASFEFGGSSHQPCRYEVSGTGILTFTFDPIYLVDSATNEESSKGFVSYSVKKKADAPVGEVIRNTAHIYFDFNPAIVTNTTENEVTTLVSIHDVKAEDNLRAKVYPNPFSETATIEISEKLADAKLIVTNLAGQVVQEYSSENGIKWQISKEGLSQGMYTFTIYSNGKSMLRGKLIAE